MNYNESVGLGQIGSSRQELFCKKDAIKNFAREAPAESLFQIYLQSKGLQLY